MKLIKVFAGFALAVSAVTSASAFVLYPGKTGLEDDNLEQLIKGSHCVLPIGPNGANVNVASSTGGCGNAPLVANTSVGVLEVGDRLRGVIEFTKIRQLPFGAAQNTPSPELTGLFDTEVYQITPNAGDPTLATIVWGPNSSFASTYGAGAMVSLFTGGLDLDVNSCMSAGGAAGVLNCETLATDGNHWATAGYGDLDDIWVSTNSILNFGTVAGIDQSSTAASVNYALSILTNNTGYAFNEQQLNCGLFPCLGDGKTDVIGSGTVQGGLGLPVDTYGATSDIQLELNVVPEPGSLALFALALSGLGFATRRRSNK